MLSIRERQEYLKKLGLYSGVLDGVEGSKTKAAYLELQKKYFTREKDIDGMYGPNTDTLLQNAFRVEVYTKNFDLDEFKCNCGGKYCTGYPAILDVQLLRNLQDVRDKYGPAIITSGMRCKRYNNSLAGSSATSRHMKGKALDIFLDKTKMPSGRKEVMAYWKKLPRYNYTYCNIDGSHPNMGNAVHVDVK